MTTFLAEIIPPRINASIIFCSWLTVALGSYTSFNIFTRMTMRSPMTFRRAAIILLAATCLTLGSWTCQLLSSRFSFIPPRNTLWLLPFDNGLVVLSFFAPLCIIYAAFLVSASATIRTPWLACIGGCCVGLSIGLMEYALYLSLGHVRAVHSIRHTTGAFTAVITVSVLAFLSMLVLQSKWRQCPCIRVLVPTLFSIGISGSSFLSLSGMRFFVTGLLSPTLLATWKDKWDKLTLVVPFSVSAVLLCLIVTMSIADIAKPRLLRQKPATLVVASLAFTEDGRVLTKEDGTIPHENVDMDGIYEGLLEGLRLECDLFQWIYTLSLNWSLFTTYEHQVRIEIQAKKPSRFKPFSKRCMTLTGPFLHPSSLLKHRILEAIVKLADGLGISVSDVGCLYDVILQSGTHSSPAEFLPLSEHSDIYGDIEGAFRLAQRMQRGYMLFFVRKLPVAKRLSDDWSRSYVPRGFRLSHSHRARDYLVESTGAPDDVVDKILMQSKEHCDKGTKAVVQPDSTYLGLFASRGTNGSSEEVLVYEKAKHQIPIYDVSVKLFTLDMRAWINNARAITAGELISLCRGKFLRKQGSFTDDATRRNTCIPLTSGGDTTIERFQEALADSLEQFLPQLSFVDNIACSARLCPTVVDISCPNGGVAHLIVLHVELPEKSSTNQGSPVQIEITSPFNNLSSSGGKEPLTYVPVSFFELSRALVYGSTDEYTRHVESDLARLLSSDNDNSGGSASPRSSFSSPVVDFVNATEINDRHPCRNLNGPALVSSFSIDTISEMDAGDVVKSGFSLSTVRSWMSSSVTRINTVFNPIRRRRIHSSNRFTARTRDTFAFSDVHSRHESRDVPPPPVTKMPRTHSFLPSIRSTESSSSEQRTYTGTITPTRVPVDGENCKSVGTRESFVDDGCAKVGGVQEIGANTDTDVNVCTDAATTDATGTVHVNADSKPKAKIRMKPDIQIRVPPPLKLVTSAPSSAYRRSSIAGSVTLAGTQASSVRSVSVCGGGPGVGGCSRPERESVAESRCLTVYSPPFESRFPVSPRDSFRRNEWKNSNV